jgi:hypothetical protein
MCECSKHMLSEFFQGQIYLVQNESFSVDMVLLARLPGQMLWTGLLLSGRRWADRACRGQGQEGVLCCIV